MKKVLLLATVAAVLAAPVYANPATATNGSAAATDGASAASANAVGGRSRSLSNATGNGGAGGNATASGGHGGRASVTNNVSVGGTGGGSGNGGGGSYGGGGLHPGDIPVSSAVAPSFWGASPCSGPSASVAGQAPVFGLSFGGQQMDVSCQALRAQGSDIAEAVLCRKDSDYRRARLDIGRPCAEDRKATENVAYAPTKTEWVPAPWCGTASEAERRAHYKDCFRQ